VCVICCAVFDAAVPLLFHVGVRLLFLLLVFLCASVFFRLLSLFECPWLSFAFSRSSAWPVSYNVLKCTVWLSPMICYLFVFVVGPSQGLTSRSRRVISISVLDVQKTFAYINNCLGETPITR